MFLMFYEFFACNIQKYHAILARLCCGMFFLKNCSFNGLTGKHFERILQIFCLYKHFSFPGLNSGSEINGCYKNSDISPNILNNAVSVKKAYKCWALFS